MAVEALETRSVNEPMEKNKMGILVFIATEAIFFVFLIIAYVYYHIATDPSVKPRAKDVLDVGLTSIFTVCLLGSSVTIFIAERFLARKNRTGFLVWLLITIGLGLVFIGGQITEYTKLITQESITISSGTFGTTFFTLTGFHGLHVIIGLIMLSILAGFGIFGGWYKNGHSTAVDVISYYWHFVDVVWIFVFTFVYLLA
ncbi:MAG TPA: heme-copper oxidase subunit III [Chloroflexia bacterium]|nr:heme-copper oxidase subunit III [Chloroflexia bacterium]